MCAKPAGIHRHTHDVLILVSDLGQNILCSFLSRMILKAKLEAIFTQEGNQRRPVMTQERSAAP